MEVISRVAVSDPVDVGLKVTLMVKLLRGLIVLLSPPLIVNNDASVPVMDTDCMVRLVPPLLVTLKEAVLVHFTFTSP